MRCEVGIGDRRATTAIALTTAKRAARSGALWGLLFGVLVLNEVLSYHTNFPTVAARERFAQTFGGNAGLAAVIGPARRLDTIEGFVAWRMFGLLIIVGAIWGLLTATRLLRGEEDAGRWELLLAGRTTRRHATVQAIAGLAAGFVVLWTLTAGLAVAAGSRSSVDFPVSASLFYATGATASAAMFLAIGALTSQLSPTRRQANGLAAAAFGASFLIRMVADSGTGLAWMRWASPLGWVENLRPLTGSQPLALVPVILLVAAAAGAAVIVAGRRDLGAGVLARPGSVKANTRFLGGPVSLVARLERWVAVAWIGGLAMLALIFGVVARSAAEANVGVKPIEEAVGRLGGDQGGAAAWIGYEFLFIAALVAFAAAAQISAMRSEEADGYLDNLLARRVSRRAWLAGRLGFGVALVAVVGLVTGLGGWIGLATRRSDIGFAAMFQAGLNVTAPALFVLGVGTLLYGLAPRLAVPILYGLVLWSFVIEIIGASITTNHWLLDTAVLSHLGPVPATSLDWTAIAWLTGLGVIAALVGLAAFERRDLAAA
ncbi:ABC transporter permease subunit [Streptomyces sp. NPDC023998]|uniref:ABC transporter permease n=1 Tax=Streptomyces sp. NPDC023998 TaxID=3154597 RepID=UPI0033CE8387